MFSSFDNILFVILLLLVLIAIFISSSEVAFFSLSEEDLDTVRSKYTNDSKLVSILESSERLLTSIIIAYTIINISLIILLLYILQRFSFFSLSGFNELLLLSSIAFFLILFIEILPKLLASHNPLKIARRNLRGVVVIDAVISPISGFLVNFSNVINQNSVLPKHEISIDELSKALELTSDQISFGKEKDMLQGIIRFHEKDVHDILISRADMISLEITKSFEEVIKFIINAGYSRIPIYEENEDQIKGILYVKDLLPHIDKSDTFKWQTLIRPAYFVPGSKRIDELLEEFRTNKNHIAIVVDEYGGTIGIVTMEDILEEIVGEISDEYDEDLPFYTEQNDGSYIFDGKITLTDFLKAMNIPEREFDDVIDEVDTLAGLILELKGTFPKQKEYFYFKKYTFQAEEINKRRIVKVRYIPSSE